MSENGYEIETWWDERAQGFVWAVWFNGERLKEATGHPTTTRFTAEEAARAWIVAAITRAKATREREAEIARGSVRVPYDG
jgi:hypothetical protein